MGLILPPGVGASSEREQTELYKAEPGELGDYYVIGKLWESLPQVNGEERTLRGLVENYIEAGYSSLGLVEVMHDQNKGEGITLKSAEFVPRYQELKELKEEYKGKINIQLGFAYDTAAWNPNRFNLPIPQMVEMLDYVLLLNVHSKAVHRGIVRSIKDEFKPTSGGENTEKTGKTKLDLLLKDLNAEIEDGDVEGLKQKQTAQAMLKGYSGALTHPTYTIGDVIKLHQLLPGLKIGLVTGDPADDLRGYVSEPVVRPKVIEEGDNTNYTLQNIRFREDGFVIGDMKMLLAELIRKPVDELPEITLNTVLHQGITPAQFADVMSRGDMFLVMPFSHEGRTGTLDSTESFMYWIREEGYADEMRRRGVSVVPGSQYPLGARYRKQGQVTPPWEDWGKFVDDIYNPPKPVSKAMAEAHIAQLPIKSVEGLEVTSRLRSVIFGLEEDHLRFCGIRNKGNTGSTILVPKRR